MGIFNVYVTIGHLTSLPAKLPGLPSSVNGVSILAAAQVKSLESPVIPASPSHPAN